MRTMRSAAAEIDGAKSIADENAGGIFLGGVNRIFQIENDRVGRMQTGVDEVLRLVSRQVEAGASQPVARRRRWKCRLFR